MDLGVILTFLNIVKIGFEIIERFRPAPNTKAVVQPETVSVFKQAVHEDLGPQIAKRIRSDQQVSQGLTRLSNALGDWQMSSTRLCPLLLRKALSFGFEEKNLGFLPSHENPEAIESAYQEWKTWIEQGPRNNEGLLVFVLESPQRQTIETIQALNQRKSSVYHKPRFGCVDVRSGTFYGPPRGWLDEYLQGFGVDTFWNEIMNSVGSLIA